MASQVSQSASTLTPQPPSTSANAYNNSTRKKEKVKLWTTQITARERQIVKDICSKLSTHTLLVRRTNHLNGMKNLAETKELTRRTRLEKEMIQVEYEALAAIINKSERRKEMKARLNASLRDTDDEPMQAVFQHREEFIQFLWRKRLERKRHTRNLFQDGPKMICKVGDLLSEATLETLRLFEQNCQALMCKMAVQSSLCVGEDIPSFFLPRKPMYETEHVAMDAQRFSFGVKWPESSPAQPTTNSPWTAVYGTDGPWSIRLLSKPLQKDIVNQAYRELLKVWEKPEANNYSFREILAKVLDACFPSHQLQAMVLAFPQSAGSMLKKRLNELGFSVNGNGSDVAATSTAAAAKDPAADPEASELSLKTTVEFIRLLSRRLDREMRFYFEFTVTDYASWRVGFADVQSLDFGQTEFYPGATGSSFGFGSNGCIYYEGKEYSYIEDVTLFLGMRTYGIVVDLYEGTMGLVIDGKIQVSAFGKRSHAFSESEGERQRNTIQNCHLIPVFAVQVSKDKRNAAGYVTQVTTNFGSLMLSFHPNCLTIDQSLVASPLKGTETGAASHTADSANHQAFSATAHEEEEKYSMAHEKNGFRAAFMPEQLRCFSQFPPSVYRRSLAGSIIQNCWRRYRGRQYRKRLRETYFKAALMIQRAARRLLKRIRERKAKAALLVQKNWRKTLYIRVKLLSVSFQQPLADLHHAARVIQNQYRKFSLYRNSPIAVLFSVRLTDLMNAVVKIQRWWRPLAKRVRKVHHREKLNAQATTIQRVWRGYRLRRMLRPELRQRLLLIGQSVLKHRKEFMRINSAYVIQHAWRTYIVHKMRLERVRTRNRAASRLQALWKGYWIRSHIHLQFDYGEAIYLTAVCKALKQCHYLLKMYRPCGLVCPKRENRE